MTAEAWPEGRTLTVRTTEVRQRNVGETPGAIWWRWLLVDDDNTELAHGSIVYDTASAAADAAREIFGGWLGSVIGIDLERLDGQRERLR